MQWLAVRAQCYKIYFLNEIGAPAKVEMKDEQTVSSILEDVSEEVQSNDMIEDEDDIADTEEDEFSEMEDDNEGLLIRNIINFPYCFFFLIVDSAK